ncbi:MAG: hypothetical protein JWM21_3725 [Acidobacteria bacterium]|nr:hypothetical protein [Acidobacteriota bacterium]
MKISPRLALLFLACLLFRGAVDAQYLHPRIVEKKAAIHYAVLLPAKVEITKESAKGSEMMAAESEETSRKVAEAVGETLKEKRISLLKSPFEGESATTDDNHKYLLANIQTRYDSLLPKLVSKSKDVKKGRFTLGDEVMLLNVDKSADVLVFIRGQGRVFTKGKTAFSLLNPFSFDFPFVFITIGMVDAHTGEVLVFTKPVSATNVLKNPKGLNKLITKSLKKLPVAS